MSQELKNLLDTHDFLESIQRRLQTGPLFPWSFIKHAKEHINDQIQGYFKGAV